MKTAKALVMSFLVGGFFSVVGQLVFQACVMICGETFPLLGPVTLAGLGLIVGLLWICGIEQKIEKIGEYGAILHFGSCASACAALFQNTRAEGGSVKAAIKAGIFPVLFVCGIGTLTAGILGVLLALLK